MKLVLDTWPAASVSKTLERAHWGKCCFCTISVRRYGFGFWPHQWLPHHQLELRCPSSQWGSEFVITLDRWPKKPLAGPAEIRYGVYESRMPYISRLKNIPCDIGQALKKRIDLAYPKSSAFSGDKDTDSDNLLMLRHCRSFANYWYDLAGDGWLKCEP